MGVIGRNRMSTTVHSSLNATVLRLLITIVTASLIQVNEAVRSQSPLDANGIQITYEIGKDAVMTCTVKDLGTRRIIWSKLSDPYPISVGNTRFNPRKNYKIDVLNNKSTLTVRDVKLEDAGEYLCRVSGQVPLADIVTLNIKIADTDNTHLLKSETEVLAEIGSTIKLPCEVENLNNNLVLWKNNQNDVLTLRRKIYNGDSRLKIVHNTKTEWSLQIKKVQMSDFGLYTCVINSQPVLTRTVQLKNKTPSQFAPLLLQDSSFRKRVDALSGETVNLTCIFRASPPANVSWLRRKIVNGKPKEDELGHGTSYILQSASHEQSGQYICIGDNGLNPQGRGKIQLTIAAPPTAAPVIETTRVMPTGLAAPTLYADQKVVGVKRGRNVELRCTAVGSPKPNMHWSRKGIRLGNDARYNITTTAESDHYTRNSVLLVRSLTDPHYGEYTCDGYNYLGRVVLQFELYIVD